MAVIISFINYKGGVGKTTSTYHVGCALAQYHAKKVLLIDIDPQTNLTFLCASIENWKKYRASKGTIASMYSRFSKHQPIESRRAIWKEPIETSYGKIKNLDLIPCDIDLLGEDLGGSQVHGTFPTIEALRLQADNFLRERSFLRLSINEILSDYDYVLIDCPPNLYLMTQNALASSNYYVVTAIPDHLSTIGLSILQDKVVKIGKLIEAAKSISNKHNDISTPKFGGVIFVKCRIGGSMITNTHKNIIDKIRDDLGDSGCFNTKTTELIGYAEAAEQRLPVWDNDTDNSKRAANKFEYVNIAKEFLGRFNESSY